MKILLFTQSFPPPEGAGSVQYLANIFAALPPQTAVIVTGNAEPAHARHFDLSFPQKIMRFRFIVHSAYGYKTSKAARAFEYLLWPLTAGWLILREKPQVVHIGEFNMSCIAAVMARRLLRIPYVFFTYAEEITHLAGRRVYLYLLNAVLRNADAVITVSEFTRSVLEELGTDPAKIYKILPAVGHDKRVASTEEVEALRAKHSLRGNHVLLTVGRLVERKGHATMIQALPSIIHSFPATRYVIVGTGPEEHKLRELVRRTGVEDYVLFTGRIDDSELSCWYEICDVFVMPHRELPSNRDTEGCPTVFLEAGAHGKAVIGGRDGGVADAILHDRTGLVIDGRDACQLAESVCNLFKTPELAERMGAAGRAYAASLGPESRAAAIQDINMRLTTACGNVLT